MCPVHNLLTIPQTGVSGWSCLSTCPPNDRYQGTTDWFDYEMMFSMKYVKFLFVVVILVFVRAVIILMLIFVFIV